MEPSEKSKILVQLSRSDSEKAVAALKIETEKSLKILLSENDYLKLSQTLDELEIFAFRVAEDIIEVSKKFLDRLMNDEIDYSFFGSKLPEIYTADKIKSNLISKNIALLSRIRYHAIPDVFEIVLPLTLFPTNDVSRAASDLLANIGRFNLDIFYGGEGYRGIGATPQIQLLEQLEKHKAPELLAHIGGITRILNELLSPDMRGDDWDYDKVTLKFGAVPATDDIAKIRQRAIELAFRLYEAADNIGERRALLGTLFGAASTPSHGAISTELKSLITKNTLEIFEFLKSIVPTQDVQVIQKIEHDTYWLHYHAFTDEAKNSALEIRDLIEANNEYTIYKNLVGFEGIFDRWEESRGDTVNFKAIEESRSAKVIEYAQNVDEENWPTWRARIIDYARTESNDLATFPRFYEFLEQLAVLKPDLAMTLIVDDLDLIQPFTIPIYRGLWSGPLKIACKQYLLRLIGAGQQLKAVTKLFLSVDNLDHDLINLILEQATLAGDHVVLTELLGVAYTKYPNEPNYAVEKIFRPALLQLNALNMSYWIESIWFNKEARNLISELGPKDRNLVYSAFVMIDQISYRAEEILIPLVSVDAEGVIDLFGARIKQENKRQGYDAIPFQFYRLNESLAAHADLLTRKVRNWFAPDDHLFQFTGGKFLSGVFPQFDDTFSAALSNLIATGEDDDINFVIAIMRNYEGDVFLHQICREIIIRKSDDEKIMSGVEMVLYSTGVVSGEYGHVEAYQRKITEIQPWLDDPERVVVEFAHKYIDMLQRSAENERERADEEIALRKHRFGHRD